MKTVSVFTKHYPQTAYARFTFCLQNEWHYVQHVVADTASFFAPLEMEIWMSFLPVLLGIPSTEIDGGYHQLLTHGVKQGGLAIRNSVDTAPSVHSPSLAATCQLMVSLVDFGTQFNLGAHCHCATEARQMARKSRLTNERLFLDRRGQNNLSVARPWESSTKKIRRKSLSRPIPLPLLLLLRQQ
jgi:hypothetical protein